MEEIRAASVGPVLGAIGHFVDLTQGRELGFEQH